MQRETPPAMDPQGRRFRGRLLDKASAVHLLKGRDASEEQHPLPEMMAMMWCLCRRKTSHGGFVWTTDA